MHGALWEERLIGFSILVMHHTHAARDAMVFKTQIVHISKTISRFEKLRLNPKTLLHESHEYRGGEKMSRPVCVFLSFQILPTAIPLL